MITRAVTSPATLASRAGSEPSQSLMFHNHGEGPYLGLLLVDSYYYTAFTFKTLLRHYAKLAFKHSSKLT